MTEHASAGSEAGSVTITFPTTTTYSVPFTGGWWGVVPPPMNHMEQFAPMPYPAAYAPVEVEDDIEEQDEPAEEIPWEGILGFEGHPTDDRRYLIPGDITERELPLTLMGQILSADGHDNSVPVGRIDRIWRLAMPTIGPRAVAIMGAGVFDISAHGQEFARLVDEKIMRGVSFDLAPYEYVPIDPSTYEPIPEDDPALAERMMSGDVLIGMKAKIMGATLVPFPAFADANVRVVAADKVLLACAHAITLVKESLTASAAGIAPLKPPADWFATDETPGPCPLTVTPDGRVFGHLATWDQCHTGFPNACQLAPRSATDYRMFHVGALETDDGTQVAVGRIIVGGNDGHAPIGMSADAAQAFYDKTGSVGAFVRAQDGRHGIWLSGCVRSDAPASVVRDLRANPPSGDWRRVNGNLELIAASAVPVPGFPVPRVEYALTASAGAEDEVTALVAATPVLALPMALQVVLANAVSMYLSASGAHWDVTGPDFAEYHDLFGDIYEDVQGSIDPLAENILKLGGRAPTAIEQYAQMARVPSISDTGEPRGFAAQLAVVNDVMIGNLQDAFAVADASNEQGVANFLAERIDMHQKWRWQLRASLGETAAAPEQMSARALMRQRTMLANRLRAKLA